MKHYLLAILLFFSSSGFAEVTLFINPSTVQLDETFRLTLTMTSAPTGVMPDLTPLQSNFIFMGTERSIDYSMVNGKTHSVSQWSILLKAKKVGDLPIPPIQVGQEYTKADAVHIIATGNMPNTDHVPSISAPDMMIKTEVNEKNPFVNQQVTYIVKFYNRQQLLDSEYQPPRVEGALFIPLGDERHYQTTENGQVYSVEEQQFAVIPQHSGQLKIIAPKLNALIYDTLPRRSQTQGKLINLTVKPKPSHYTGKTWLPAKQVVLMEQYDKGQTTLPLGSTIERYVTLEAVGVPGQLLPALTFANHHAFNVYPEKPAVENIVKPEGLVGTARVKVTYILSHAGKITIPPLTLPWFNSLTGKEELAMLPARTFQVEAKVDTNQKPAVVKSVSTKKMVDSSLKSASFHSPVATKITSYLPWFLAFGLIGIGLFTFTLCWFRGRVRLAPGQNKAAVLKRLQMACASNDPRDAPAALLAWAHLQWPEITLRNLNDVAQMVGDPAFKAQLSLLSQVLYHAQPKTVWQGAVLWDHVANYRKQPPAKKEQKKQLPPLNPN